MIKKLFKQTASYYLVSLFSVVVNLLLYSFLIYFFKINYLISATIGFVVENIINYWLNRSWTFKDTRVSLKQGYVRSLLVAVATLSIILCLTSLGVNFFLLDYLTARIIAGVIAGIVSYILDSKYSFKVW